MADPGMRAVKPCCHQLGRCLRVPAAWECRVDRSSWDPQVPWEIAGLCLHCLPSSLGTEVGAGCVHTGGGAGMWEEPAARPQMVALPTSATSLPCSRRGSVEKVGEAECLAQE